MKFLRNIWNSLFTKPVYPTYVLGDIHGNWRVILSWVEKFDIRDSYLIQVGDFGIGFGGGHENGKVEYMNTLLKDHNINLFVVRGNHDNPEYFDGDHDKSNIKFVPDYTVLDLKYADTGKVLCVGGAISIDRSSRKLDDPPTWFPREIFVFDGKKLSEFRDIKVVITHTAPPFAWPVEWNGLVYDWADRDPGLYHELPAERLEIEKMHDTLKVNNQPVKWYYGHFHNSQKAKHFNTEFILLAIDEFQEIRI